MDPRSPADIEATGTLPAAGEGSVPLTSATEPVAPARPDWIDEARAALEAPGKYLAYEDGSRRVVIAVAREWTRIGRSLAADVRFDDATVSRRHALIVAQADGVRVLDDRSLNGVYVNGRRVEWSPADRRRRDRRRAPHDPLHGHRRARRAAARGAVRRRRRVETSAGLRAPPGAR